MNNSLQTQFPLAKRRKFWKKMIEKGLIFFFLTAFVTFSLAMIVFSNTSLPLIKTVSIVLGFEIFIFGFIWGLYGIYVHYYIKTYYYSDDNDFLTIKKGVFMPAEIHVQYLKIQDVYVDQDILDRILGIYDVHISSATYSSGIAAHIDGVTKENADGLKTLLLGKIKNSALGQQAHHQTTQAQNHPNTTTEPVKARFDSPISSEAYGLSSDWWIGEFVKLALGSIFGPVIITFWVFSSDINNNSFASSWLSPFWLWLSVLIITIVYRITYLLLWKSHYSYNFGEEYIYMKTGVISISEKNMAYSTIQDVRINQSLVDRIFKVADVVIENASANMTIVNQKAIAAGLNGIVIEGLSLTDAKKVTEEVKKVIINKGNLTRGL